MRRYLGVLVAIAALAAFAGEASAMKFTQLGKISEASLLDSCNKGGGKFTNFGSTHNNQSLRCNKANCNGKGGDCRVPCQAKTNEGSGFPRRARAKRNTYSDSPPSF